MKSMINRNAPVVFENKIQFPIYTIVVFQRKKSCLYLFMSYVFFTLFGFVHMCMGQTSSLIRFVLVLFSSLATDFSHSFCLIFVTNNEQRQIKVTLSFDLLILFSLIRLLTTLHFLFNILFDESVKRSDETIGIFQILNLIPLKLIVNGIKSKSLFP